MYENLTENELALLKKLGIKLPKRKRSNLDRSPKPVKLEEVSGQVTFTCKCCGTVNTSFIDYLKRKDAEGYYTVTVNTPSFPVKRYHVYDVIVCPKCAVPEALEKAELVMMINNLRVQLRKEMR